MAYDPNPANQAADRMRKMAHDDQQKWADEAYRRRSASGGTQGSPLGFVIVIAIVALVGLWIASMQ